MTDPAPVYAVRRHPDGTWYALRFAGDRLTGAIPLRNRWEAELLGHGETDYGLDELAYGAPDPALLGVAWAEELCRQGPGDRFWSAWGEAW